MSESQERPRTALALERRRKEVGLSKQRLADLADVSATYVRTIEAGFDHEGREVVPSAVIMQKLARGLAQGETDEVRRAELESAIYAEMMDAAGYLDRIPVEEPMPKEPPAPGLGAPPEEPAPSTSHQGPVTVTLRDPRLLRHAADLLENWESLHDDDQTLLLGFLEFVHTRHGRATTR
jgi:transcriptional regulator with XRE-family HTH domain